MWGRVLCSGLLSLCLCGAVWAEVDKVSLVTGDDYAPFTGQDLPDGVLVTKVVRAALAEREVTSSLEWRPWNRGLLMTLKGRYDATFPYTSSLERQTDYLYSEPMLVISEHVYSLAGAPLEADNLAALEGKRLCLPLGWQPPAAIQNMIDQRLLQVHAPVGLIQCVELLLLGRNDFFVAGSLLAEAALREVGEPLSRLHRSQSAFGDTSLHLLVARSHPRAEQVLQQFNEGLALLRERGDYPGLIQHYLQQRNQQAAP
jgi:polar amino acid transport system substrate-binding protein